MSAKERAIGAPSGKLTVTTTKNGETTTREIYVKPSQGGTATTTTKPRTKVVDITKAIDQAKNDLADTKADLASIRASQTPTAIKISKIEAMKNRIAIETKNIRTLSSIKTQAVTTGPPKPRRSTLNKPPILFSEVIQGFYDKSNYPSKVEMTAALDKYGLAAKDQFKPQTVNEAANRALYAVSETIGGGIRWATLGLTGSLGAENRGPAAQIYQTLGAVLMPTVQDMAANAMVGKALQTKAGRALIAKFNKYKGKLTKPSALSAKQLDELSQLTKINDPDYWKTPDGMKLFEQLNKRVTHYLENPEAYTAGASVIPEEVYIYQTLPPGMTPDIYTQFVAKYGDNVDLSTKALLALFASGGVPRIDDVLKDMGKAGLDQPLKDLSKSKLDQLAKQLEISGQELAAMIDLDLESNIYNTDPVEDTGPIEDITPIQDTPPIKDPKPIPPPTETPPPTDDPKPVDPTPPIILSDDDVAERREINLKLYNGPSLDYRVKYYYKQGRTETLLVPARNLLEAIGRAQRMKRPSKTMPYLVDIKKVK